MPTPKRIGGNRCGVTQRAAWTLDHPASDLLPCLAQEGPRDDKSIGSAHRAGPLLVVKLAKENPTWGYTRILGEIRKLTSAKVSRQFVVNIMKEHGFDPGPKRGEKTWDEFIKLHAATLWQCDFFSKKVLTLTGIRELFVIAFLHVGTRKVFVTKATAHPTAEWVTEQAKAFCRHAKEEGLKPEYVYRDRDCKFGKAFDGVFEEKQIEVRRSPIRAPNMNAFVERWIQSAKVECLDHFLVLGEAHLNHLVSSYVNYYLRHRPHQGLDNAVLTDRPDPDEDVPTPGELRCERWLGGSLKHYSRKAA